MDAIITILLLAALGYWLYTRSQKTKSTARHSGQQQPAAPIAVTGPSVAITRSKKKTSHGLHLFLSIITCGTWAMFVWFPLTLWHIWGPKRRETTQYV